MRVVIGFGLTSNATFDDLNAALATAIQAAQCGWTDVVEIATIESRRGHPALARRDCSVRFHSAATLASMLIPHPSTAVARATGTASVAEAAALASSGARELLIPKRCTTRVCTAVAAFGGTA